MMRTVYVLSSQWRVVFSHLRPSAGVCWIESQVLSSSLWTIICWNQMSKPVFMPLPPLLRTMCTAAFFHLTVGSSDFFSLLTFGLPTWSPQVCVRLPESLFVFTSNLAITHYFPSRLGIVLGVQLPQVSLLNVNTMFSILWHPQFRHGL